MFYKYIKLSSGDNIIAATEDSCATFKNKEFIEINNPVQVGSFKHPKGGMIVETHLFMPWIAMSSTETIKLPTKSIIVTVDVDDNVVKQYENYIARYNRNSANHEEDHGEDTEYFFEEEYELEDDEDDGSSDQRQLH